MPNKQTEPLLIDDAKIIFRNFAGREGLYNSEGDRNFSVVLEPKLAKKLLDAGWRVKQLKPREEGEEGDYHLKVTVNYKKGRPPRCVMITSRGRTDLGADEVGLLDVADIKKVDLLLNGWWSDMAGGGFSAFLKSAFVTISEDALELRYAGVGDSGVIGDIHDDEED
jgi:hypothetical protein